MARRADTSERVQAVEIVASQTALMTADGRPVRAASEYTSGAMTADGRPIRAASVSAGVIAEGGPVIPYALFTAGTLMTPDGRPVEALQFFDAAGASTAYGGGGASYAAESDALFARMTTAPTTTRKGHIDTFIKALKAGATSGSNIWAKIDVLYVLAAADEQAALLEWKGNTAYNAVKNGTPTFTADRGFAGNVAGDYLATGYLPASGATLGLTPSNGHLAAFVLTDNSIIQQDIGFQSSFYRVMARGVGAAAQGGISNSSASTLGPTGTNPSFVVGSRLSASSAFTYRNATAGTENTAAITAAYPAAAALLLGTTTATTLRQTAIASVGQALTAAEVTDYYNAARAYLQAVGVSV